MLTVLGRSGFVLSGVSARRVKAGGIALLAVGGLAIAASSGRATVQRTISCQSRPGATLLENTSGRVYRSRGQVFACAFVSRQNYLLVPRNVRTNDQANDLTYVLRSDQLQGRFTAWLYTKFDGLGTTETLKVLDLRTGHMRTAHSSVSDDGDHTGDWVLNGRGVVVYLYRLQGGQEGRVIESSPAGNAILAEGGATPNQFTALGVSASGDYVYWLDNGVPRSARIS